MNVIKSLPSNPNWVYNNIPDTIVLHHAEASICTIQDINQWHLNNGWNGGCGYHFLVRKDGSIYAGRPENSQGAHCPGYNTHSIGICAEGEYMTETMPEAQYNAIVELCKDIKVRYNITNIVGHGEVYNTSCPGKNYPLERVKKLDNEKLDWKGIIEKVASNPAGWETGINTAVAAAKANGDLGSLEIFQYLPELIVKIYNR